MQLYFYGKEKKHTSSDTDSLICKAVCSYTGKAFTESIRRTGKGKPYIENGLFIGASHTLSTVVIGVDEKNFGIDCEDPTRTVRDRELITKRFFSEDETRYIQSFPEDKRDRAFLELWVKKEAYVKFTGDGLSGISKTDVTKLRGFEKVPNDYGLIIYIYKENA